MYTLTIHYPYGKRTMAAIDNGSANRLADKITTRTTARKVVVTCNGRLQYEVYRLRK